MSIINTFDYDGEEIIKPGDNVKTIEDLPQTVLVVFSVKMRDLFLNTYHPSKIGALYAAGWELPIWQFEYKGRKMGFFHTILGGAGAAALLEELLALGAEKCLYFGVCGALDKEIAAGHLLVPTAAYRDEGVSYHYVQSSDYIESRPLLNWLRFLRRCRCRIIPQRPGQRMHFTVRPNAIWKDARKRVAAWLRWNVPLLWQWEAFAKRKCISFCTPETACPRMAGTNAFWAICRRI